jgi:hypothetical protein
MSYLVLNRINAQLLASKRVEERKEKIQEVKQEEITKPQVTPIRPEELKEILMEELKPEESPEKTEQGINEDKIFSGVEDFVDWLIPIKHKFSKNQLIPLTTLIQVKEAINVGCGCRRKNRIEQANQYFQTFWEKNKNTDLPATVLAIGNFKSITFSVPNTQNFLIYPSSN